MTSYGIFAKYYDALMRDVDYAARTDYICKIFRKYGLCGNTVLDLACGTGAITYELVKRGFDVIGVDKSEQMLAEAVGKNGGMVQNPMFICQDMKNLDLYGTVSAAVSVLDGINHLDNCQSVKTAFSRVSLFLDKGGLFVFDLNSPYKIENTLGNNTFVYDLDEVYCVWQNSYDSKKRRCNFELTFFEFDGEHYTRSDESFSETVYSTDEIEKILVDSGFFLEAVYDDMCFQSPKEKSERLIYVARKI